MRDGVVLAEGATQLGFSRRGPGLGPLYFDRAVAEAPRATLRATAAARARGSARGDARGGGACGEMTSRGDSCGPRVAPRPAPGAVVVMGGAWLAFRPGCPPEPRPPFDDRLGAIARSPLGAGSGASVEDSKSAAMDADNLEERYDRQIRLWGADAQKSISRSRALICGLNGASAEVCKNLVLAGISVTIQDSARVTAADLGAQFFLSAEDIGKNRAAAALSRVRELNAFVTVEGIEESLGAVSDEVIAKHNVVVVAAGSPDEQARLNKACRQNRIAFFAASSFGEDGGFIVDLGEEHVFRRETGTGERAVLSDPISVRFPSLEEIEAVLWSTLTERRAGPVPPVFVMGQRTLMTYRECISRSDDLPTSPPLLRARTRARASCPPLGMPRALRRSTQGFREALWRAARSCK